MKEVKRMNELCALTESQLTKLTYHRAERVFKINSRAWRGHVSKLRTNADKRANCEMHYRLEAIALDAENPKAELARRVLMLKKSNCHLYPFKNIKILHQK